MNPQSLNKEDEAAYDECVMVLQNGQAFVICGASSVPESEWNARVQRIKETWEALQKLQVPPPIKAIVAMLYPNIGIRAVYFAK